MPSIDDPTRPQWLISREIFVMRGNQAFPISIDQLRQFIPEISGSHLDRTGYIIQVPSTWDYHGFPVTNLTLVDDHGLAVGIDFRIAGVRRFLVIRGTIWETRPDDLIAIAEQWLQRTSDNSLYLPG